MSDPLIYIIYVAVDFVLRLDLFFLLFIPWTSLIFAWPFIGLPHDLQWGVALSLSCGTGNCT